MRFIQSNDHRNQSSDLDLYQTREYEKTLFTFSRIKTGPLSGMKNEPFQTISAHSEILVTAPYALFRF